jgi:5-formyltetrahydrofolate cyclo-ligase
MQSKREMRKELGARRDALAPEQVEEWSQAIREHLFTAPLIVDADAVLGYASKGNEVATLALIQELIDRGLSVLLPAIRGATANRVMDWLPIEDIAELSEGAFGILEPRAGKASPPPSAAPVLVPGLAFTASGLRLGHGGGFYDRFLASHSGPRIALAYEVQIVPELPPKAHDVRMDSIVTERRWLTQGRRA